VLSAKSTTGVNVKSCAGCSALHCAISAHDTLVHGSEIDSRRTVYQLINQGASIAVKVSNHSLITQGASIAVKVSNHSHLLICTGCCC